MPCVIAQFGPRCNAINKPWSCEVRITDNALSLPVSVVNHSGSFSVTIYGCTIGKRGRAAALQYRRGQSRLSEEAWKIINVHGQVIFSATVVYARLPAASINGERGAMILTAYMWTAYGPAGKNHQRIYARCFYFSLVQLHRLFVKLIIVAFLFVILLNNS